MNRPAGRRVAVTGVGAICSLGHNVDQIWDSISGYRVGYQKEHFDDPTIVAKYFGFLHNRPRKKRFPNSLLKCLPDFAVNALIAADEALTMAFGTDAPLDEHYDPFDRGVIAGTGWGGQDATVSMHDEYKSQGLVSPFTNIMGMHSVGTAAISMHWKLRGYQNTPIAACATGSMAVGDAYEIIRSGRAKMMLAGGSECIKSQFNVWTVDILRALTKEQDSIEKACCPFSMDRSGFVMSEGAAMVCLEDYDTARARGATILAELIGYASYGDAFDMTYPADDLLARAKSVTVACANAGITPSDIDYINAHGTSTPLNDTNETRSLKLALGKDAYRIPTSSTKSYTGHLIAAAGAMESIFCVRTLQTGFIPATINLNAPDPECDLDYVPNEHRSDRNIEVALNVNYGFGGTNSALVFRRAE